MSAKNKKTILLLLVAAVLAQLFRSLQKKEQNLAVPMMREVLW